MFIPMTIAGRSVRSAERMPVENPASAEAFAQVPRCTATQLDDAVRSAVAAFDSWSRSGEDARRAALRTCGSVLAQATEELAGLLTTEQGKPLRQALAEVSLAADWFGHTAQLSLPRQLLVDDGAVQATMEHAPVGPVAAIAPSNYPILLAVTKIAPALLAGNTVVLKPSPVTPLASLRMAQLLAEVLPTGVLSAVSGDGDLGPALVTHPAIRMISFTGSTRSGRAIGESAAATFKRTVLELGGNDPCVLMPGTAVDQVAGEIFRRATTNSGQFCAAIKRIYVPAAQAAELTEALHAEAQAATVGDGHDPDTDLGPLVSRAQLEHVQRLVEEATRAGASVVTGGAALPRPGHFFPPTVVTDLPYGTDLEQDEQFGPVLPVIGYDDIDEAVARANGTRFALGGSVWGDPEAAQDLAARLECGTAWVNTHGDLRHDVPFGGLRESGTGVEYGYWGLLEYTNIRIIHARRQG
ncbi:aldehyde dehydrogenase family protein [Solwaraspora sp. WMMD791]|uniref:aldehyde dehydrogenase family protein n=1 Tax=Solwaraspora sp. WMMD791 TaxID=3016086 RepID=UPI00249C10E1|nr:aldehyde dehydrogenase family protein [Solwaraspora sp. WMMD791]WFE28741.1 aldehyde dehydrogenase family protein [Solwaraspora sp. WMMD791]